MVRLSVNVNKVATLRNARGGSNPDVLAVAMDCERFGAHGITVHPRSDERHIRYTDALTLSRTLSTELNIEGYPNERFMRLIAEARPAQATLVPDAPDTITSNAGWDTLTHQAILREVAASIRQMGVRVSIFVEASEQMVEGACAAGADRVELYTGPYAHGYKADRETAVAPYVRAAERAVAIGLQVNAGHDLDLTNLAFFVEKTHVLTEVSIGHALICDALYFGLERTIKMYLERLSQPAAHSH